MDNKITKKRLAGLLTYDWLILIAIVVAVVFVWELIFAFTSVKLTTGQNFYCTYDIGVTEKNRDAFISGLNDNKALSGLNILRYNSEGILEDTDLLGTRLQVYDCDVLFTSVKEDEESKYSRGKSHIDQGYAYNFATLLSDAKAYLDTLKTNGEFDDEKIKQHFLTRMDGDNRFRTDEQKAEGIEKEKERVVKLESDVADFEKILANDQILYRYTRYAQAVSQSSEDKKAQYEQWLQMEKDNGRENAVYGINLSGLNGGTEKDSITKYVTAAGSETADNVVLMAMNFLEEQPVEQFEVIGFINFIVRQCSTVLD